MPQLVELTYGRVVPFTLVHPSLVLSAAVIELLTNGLPGLDATGQHEYLVRSVLVGVADGMALGVAGYVLGWQGHRLRRAAAG